MSDHSSEHFASVSIQAMRITARAIVNRVSDPDVRHLAWLVVSLCDTYDDALRDINTAAWQQLMVVEGMFEVTKQYAAATEGAIDRAEQIVTELKELLDEQRRPQ